MTRWWRLVAAGALILASLAILISAYLYTRIQRERTQAQLETCLRESDRSRATLAFLEDVKARPATVAKARTRFPVLNREECMHRASRLVPPPPAHR